MAVRLFWLFIPANLADLLSDTTFIPWPSVRLIGNILTVAVGVTMVVVYFRLGAADAGYRTAGICRTVAVALSAVVTVITPLLADQSGWMILLAIPAGIAGLMSDYYKYVANADVLTGVDDALADKWVHLWKWRFGSTVAMLAAALLILLLQILGLMVIIGGAIALVVVSILDLIYLYRTAGIFRRLTDITTS